MLPDAHRFVELPDGRCHFRLKGSDDAPVVLLLHGATVPGWEFDRLQRFLVNGGYRTLCPDLYGHGYSDRPPVTHNQALFVRQVKALLKALEITQLAAVIGHSLGASVAAHFAARHPGQLRRLVMTAPLLDFEAIQPAMRLLRTPLLGELLIHSCVVPMLKRRRQKRYLPIEDGRFARKYEEQFRVKGFGRSVLSLIRSGALGNQAAAYRQLAASRLPTLLLRGGDDVIFDAAQLAEICTLLPHARVQEFAGMGHPMMLTHPEAVGPVIVEFVSNTSTDDHRQA